MKHPKYRLRSVDVRTVGFVDASSILAISTSSEKRGIASPLLLFSESVAF